MNQLKWILCLVLMTMAFSTLQSCSKDDGNDGLNGLYLCPERVKLGNEYYDGCNLAIQIVNDNTLKYYFDLWDRKPSFPKPYNDDCESVKIGGKTYYYQSNPNTYTYTYGEGKLIIPMKGEIYTVSGKNLYLDGSSKVFTKK